MLIQFLLDFEMRAAQRQVMSVMEVIIIIIIVNEFHRDASLTKTSGLYNMIIPI